ncbi:spindle pole body component 110-like [Nicotiana sylvestris]|uniref:spindle pole body component 110-like n=1 Tax=Nicotiana sylvestris TaxID=4096 RepID=UPI00388CCEC1
MKIAAENQERSRADERHINGLRRKVSKYQDDLEKSEVNLARAREQLTKNAEGRAEFVRQLKRKYEGIVTNLKKRLTTLENKMAKQAKNFKAEREHCYALMSHLEEDMQQLQGQNHHDTQVLEARSQQIGHLLQEKGIIRERVREIAVYIIIKRHECEDMTRTTFFATVMTFVRQIMSDLERLQGDLTHRPLARPTDVPRAIGVEALMYS